MGTAPIADSGSKPDPAAGWCRWRHELTDGFKEGTDAFVVAFDLSLQFPELDGEFPVGGQGFPETDKGPHDRDVNPDRPLGPEDARKHGHTLLSKGPRQFPDPAPT
jgi:hypothetical protein